MSGRRRGPISKEIKSLCYKLHGGSITDGDFKERIRAIIDRYQPTGYIIMDIVVAAHKWSMEIDEHFMDKVLELLKDAHPKLREYIDRL